MHMVNATLIALRSARVKAVAVPLIDQKSIIFFCRMFEWILFFPYVLDSCFASKILWGHRNATKDTQIFDLCHFLRSSNCGSVGLVCSPQNNVLNVVTTYDY